MGTDKADAISLIERLPDGVSVETIITELQFRATILRRAGEAERGEKLIPHNEAKRRIEAWLPLAVCAGRS